MVSTRLQTLKFCSHTRLLCNGTFWLVSVDEWLPSKGLFNSHGVQRRMISVVNFFPIFIIIIFCFVVAICDLVHAVEAMYGLP